VGWRGGHQHPKRTPVYLGGTAGYEFTQLFESVKSGTGPRFVAT
jgi:hypothetical protein